MGLNFKILAGFQFFLWKNDWLSPHFSYFLSQCGYTRNDENIYISLNVWMFYPCDFIKFLAPLSKILIWSWLISVIFIKRRQTLQSMHLIDSTNISKDTFCWKSPKAKTFNVWILTTLRWIRKGFTNCLYFKIHCLDKSLGTKYICYFERCWWNNVSLESALFCKKSKK